MFEPIPDPPDRPPSSRPAYERSVDRQICAHTVLGQLPPEQLRRHGIDPANTPELKPWRMNRRAKWLAAE
jgi:hypothetical protein